MRIVLSGANAINLGEANKNRCITQELSGLEETAFAWGLLNLQGSSISGEKFKSAIELLQRNILQQRDVIFSNLKKLNGFKQLGPASG